ncbi:MAG: regulatory protein RecX [Parcubacteria group bacterium]
MNDTAYEAALRILLRRPHAEGELVEKLQRKKFSAEEVTATIGQLRAEKYLNDTKLASEFVAWHLEYKPMGRRGIRQRMLLRKFKPVDIETALQALVTPEAERCAAQKLLESRLSRESIKKLAPQEQRERLARFMLARGFDTELVLSLLDKMTQLPNPRAET